jgi:hypothetical protein
MLKNVFFLLLIANCFQLKAQTRGTVIDSLGKPIPYVNIWVDGENIGTTSEEDGTFTLGISGEKIVVFSAVGFETKKVNSLDVKMVFLKAKVNKLEEVNVIKRKGTEEIVIGKFKKRNINYFFGTVNPLITATKIEFTEFIKKHPFIKELSFLTLSDKENVTVNLRFFNVDEAGKPGDNFLNENILINVKKGKNLNRVVLDSVNLLIPNEGLFIAFEWLIIDDNKYERIINVNNNSKKTELYVSYLPSVGMVPSLTQNTWQYVGSKWRKTEKYLKAEGNTSVYDDKYQNVALTLKLTN